MDRRSDSCADRFVRNGCGHAAIRDGCQRVVERGGRQRGESRLDVRLIRLQPLDQRADPFQQGVGAGPLVPQPQQIRSRPGRLDTFLVAGVEVFESRLTGDPRGEVGQRRERPTPEARAQAGARDAVDRDSVDQGIGQQPVQLDKPLLTNELLAPCGYRPPVDALLTFGGGVIGPASRPDYRGLGLGAVDIPQLLRLALDPQLRLGDEDDPALYAPVHACVALGQLGVAEAISLLGELPRLFEENWFHQALIVAAVGVGPPCIQALRALLEDGAGCEEARTFAALAALLDRAEGVDRELNGFAVSMLIDLGATGAIPSVARISQRACPTQRAASPAAIGEDD